MGYLYVYYLPQDCQRTFNMSLCHKMKNFISYFHYYLDKFKRKRETLISIKYMNKINTRSKTTKIVI